MVIVAMPLTFSEPVPMVVALSLNVIDPVGVPAADVTVAVNVTASPNVLGVFDEETDVFVSARLTVSDWLVSGLMLVKFESPAYE